MKVKQREQRGASSSSQMALLSLQKNLLQVWENLNVDQYYQNLILSYVDSLPGHQAQSLIAKEIKATHEGSSQYFKLAERLRNRKKELSELSNLIRTSQPRSGINSETLSGASDLLNELRDHNLVVAEMLINLHRQYNSGEQNSVSDECMQMLLDLDTDNSFLKDSFLNQFVLFQQGYDPFFLYHYDMKGKKAPQISHPIIDQLFNLNISYACRLFKAKTRVLEILSSGKYNETKLFKRKSRNYEASSPKRLSTEMPGKEELRTIDRDEDRKRVSSSNFKVRKVLSLQKAKEKERKRSIDRDSTFEKQRPIINQGKLQTFAQQSQNSQSQGEDQAYKMAPVRYKKSMPRSHYFQDQKKRQELGEGNSLKYSLNFKEKLQPIGMRHQSQEGELEESKNRSSIFKRSTLRQALLKPKESIQVSSNSPVQMTRLSTPMDSSSLKSSEGKQIKMRPGKLSLPELIQYLKTLNLPQQVKNQTILNQRYEQSLSKCQSYLSQFLINSQLKAIGLIFALPDGDYLIKLWGPLKTCDQQTSKLLLSKFLDYIQKQTNCGTIYYSGSLKSLFLSLNFLAKNEKLLFRKRISPKGNRQLQFPQFLSLKCSNLLFPQENKSVNMLYSDEIQAFTQKNHHVQSAFADIDRQKLGKNILMVAKISDQIADMKAVNSLLEDEGFDTYEVNNNMKISNVSAIRLASCFNFRSGFIAGQGMFKLAGEEVMRKGESLICRVQCAQPNSQIVLGKGLPNMSTFIQQSKKSQKKGCEFTVKMFNKQLYGRMSSSSDRCSYGNWQFSLSWKDQLQGRVKHSLNQYDSFGPEPFFFGVQFQTQLIFCFEVGGDDFLF